MNFTQPTFLFRNNIFMRLHPIIVDKMNFINLKEWLHWLVVDIPRGQDIKNGIEKMKFAPSGPPRGSGKHRYIFLLFSHDTPISQNPNSNINERRGFKISRYAADNGLGQPKALNFYYTENA